MSDDDGDKKHNRTLLPPDLKDPLDDPSTKREGETFKVGAHYIHLYGLNRDSIIGLIIIIIAIFVGICLIILLIHFSKDTIIEILKALPGNTDSSPPSQE